MKKHFRFHKESRVPADRFRVPFQDFVEKEASAGILLLICTLVAMIWANSPWAESYFHLWEIEMGLDFGIWHFKHPLHVWINDGMMAVFFFVVGLEIKREILVGELSSIKQAAFPVAAAIGGMLIPAIIYLLFNGGSPAARGWGIPMATDIAFAVGVLALLGSRIPSSLKVFLTALAIADDLGAVLVIALFYTSEIVWTNLGVGAAALGILLLANRAGIRSAVFYGIVGIGGVWLAFFLSGVHATIAGVLAAFAIPARVRLEGGEYLKSSLQFLKDFEEAKDPKSPDWPSKKQLQSLYRLSEASEYAVPPVQSLIEILHPWIVFLVLPLFALANAGIALDFNFMDAVTSPLTIGIVLGLFFGKQLGIFLFAWLSVKCRLAVLPDHIGWRHVYGTAILGGIGFTMSLFISALAFQESAYLTQAKFGILMASLFSGVVGFVYLKAQTYRKKEN